MIYESVKYVNHLGESLDLRSGGILADMSAFDDWKLAYSLMNSRIVGFKRDVASFSMPLVIVAGSEAEGAANRNRLFEIAEKDALAGKPGRLYYGDWYIRCYVDGSMKRLHWRSMKAGSYTLTIRTDAPIWTLEHEYSFSKYSQDGGLNYPFGFPFNLTSSNNYADVANPGFVEAPALVTVYGPAQSPSVTIGGNRYEVDATVPSGGRLEVDGLNKTITLYDKYGNAENAFSKRRGTQHKGSGSYVFQPVPAGSSIVTWDGSFAFDVTLYEQRGERRWIS